jgi:hypothetical protein
MRGLEPDQRGLHNCYGEAVRGLIGRLGIIEMVLPVVLRRALNPFPVPVRTFDAIHLAGIDFIRVQGASEATAIGWTGKYQLENRL